MHVLEFKVKGKRAQYQSIEEAIRIAQFVRNKCLRYWMDRGQNRDSTYGESDWIGRGTSLSSTTTPMDTPNPIGGFIEKAIIG